jgi:hypothetical protein
VECPFGGEVRRWSRAYAEPYRDDARLGMRGCDRVMNGELVLQQRCGARPAGARAVAPIVERDDLTLGKDGTEIERQRVRIPGIAPEGDERRGVAAGGQQAQPDELSCLDLKRNPLGIRWQLGLQGGDHPARKDEPSLREGEQRHHDKVEPRCGSKDCCGDRRPSCCHHRECNPRVGTMSVSAGATGNSVRLPRTRSAEGDRRLDGS